mgnify:CR=1 FL=1
MCWEYSCCSRFSIVIQCLTCIIVVTGIREVWTSYLGSSHDLLHIAIIYFDHRGVYSSTQLWPAIALPAFDIYAEFPTNISQVAIELGYLGMP